MLLAKRIAAALISSRPRPIRRAQAKRTRYYIRFGDVPEGGKSSIGEEYRTKTWKGIISDAIGDTIPETEEGVSVYEAFWRADLHRWEIPSGNEQLLVGLGELSDSGRPVYLMTGEEVVEGEDGEPLLDASTIKTITTLRPEDLYNHDSEFEDEAPGKLAKEFDETPYPFNKGAKDYEGIQKNIELAWARADDYRKHIREHRDTTDTKSPSNLNIPWKDKDDPTPTELEREKFQARIDELQEQLETMKRKDPNYVKNMSHKSVPYAEANEPNWNQTRDEMFSLYDKLKEIPMK